MGPDYWRTVVLAIMIFFQLWLFLISSMFHVWSTKILRLDCCMIHDRWLSCGEIWLGCPINSEKPRPNPLPPPEGCSPLNLPPKLLFSPKFHWLFFSFNFPRFIIRYICSYALLHHQVESHLTLCVLGAMFCCDPVESLTFMLELFVRSEKVAEPGRKGNNTSRTQNILWLGYLQGMIMQKEENDEESGEGGDERRVRGRFEPSSQVM